MLTSEDYVRGLNLSVSQREYRRYMPEILAVKNGQRRPWLAVGITPKLHQRTGDQVLTSLAGANRIIRGARLDFWLMFDSLTDEGTEITLAGQTAVVEDDSIVVGRKGFVNYDYGLPPFLPCQGRETHLLDTGDLLAPHAGMLRVRKVDRFVDLCIGDFGRPAWPKIAVRLLREEASCPEQVDWLGVDLAQIPFDGRPHPLRRVQSGDVMVRLLKDTHHWIPKSDGQLRHWPNVIPAVHTTLFLFNAMHAAIMDRVHQRTEQDDTPVPVLWEVPQQNLPQLVDQSPRLKAELLAAVSPDGLQTDDGAPFMLKLRSRHGGVLEAVRAVSDYQQCLITDRGRQLVPLYSCQEGVTLGTEDEHGRHDLQYEMSLRPGMIIGDTVPRMDYRDWETLEVVAAENVGLMAEEFLLQRGAVLQQDSLLVPSIYVTDLSLVTRDQDGPVWHLDLRNAPVEPSNRWCVITLPRCGDFVQAGAISYSLDLSRIKLQYGPPARTRSRATTRT